MHSTHNPWKDVKDFQKQILGIKLQPQIGEADESMALNIFECLREELGELLEGFMANNGVEVADALVDLIYFAYGAGYKLGLPMPEIWDLVHAANMKKVPGITHRGVPGDAAKPPGWEDPKIAIGILLRSIKEGCRLDEPLKDKFSKALYADSSARPDIITTMMHMAITLSKRATCSKLQVGCVLTDRANRVLSAGYNGPARGRTHCGGDVQCTGHCQATHAESNAIISCHAPADRIYNCYTTWSPCVACCKQLIQTGCRNIYFLHESSEHMEAAQFWTGQPVATSNDSRFNNWKQVHLKEPLSA